MKEDFRRAEATGLDSAELSRAIVASLREHIAVVDKEGRILAVNPAWEEFARSNSDGSMAKLGVGSNYLEVCQAGATSEPDAQAAFLGIRCVLEGKIEEFSYEYPCHSSSELRWFHMRVAPLVHPAGGAVISHSKLSKPRLEEIDELGSK